MISISIYILKCVVLYDPITSVFVFIIDDGKKDLEENKTWLHNLERL